MTAPRMPSTLTVVLVISVISTLSESRSNLIGVGMHELCHTSR